MSSEPSVAPMAKRNIAAIAQLEQQVLTQQFTAERVGGIVTRFFGSLRFILVQLFFSPLGLS